MKESLVSNRLVANSLVANSLGPGRRLKIVFYNGFFGAKPDLSHLESQENVTFSSGRARYLNADAVVFHVPGLCTRRFGMAEFKLLYKPRGQLWIAWSMESAVNYPALDDPAFLRRIDAAMSYRRDADIWTPYCPPEADWLALRGDALPEKTARAPVVMLQSALANRSERFEFALGMMSRIRVDSFGRVLNNCKLTEIDQGRATKLATIARYKFCLCLENARDIDYVTEKFYDPLMVGTVPVYRGAPNIAGFSPGHDAFINADDFSGPEELCAYLHALDRDDQAYQRFFEWRRRPLNPSFSADLAELRRPRFAKLVDLVRSHACSDQDAAGETVA